MERDGATEGMDGISKIWFSNCCLILLKNWKSKLSYDSFLKLEIKQKILIIIIWKPINKYHFRLRIKDLQNSALSPRVNLLESLKMHYFI